MNKRAVIYARVSTDEQAEKGYSLQSQIEKCREFAQAENLNIVAEIKDDCSGETLDRPGFIELESILARKEANAVIAVEEDRLSRNAANTLALYNEWPEDGISLGYSETGWVNFNEESILINGVPILVAQYERVQIRKRTMSGRRNKAKSGKPVLSGVPPYGYRKQGMREDAVLVKHEDELNIVSLIFEWYTRGDGTGGPMSSRKIAQKLNTMPSAAREKGWSNVAVSRILDNEIYAGTTYYGRTQSRMKGSKRVITNLPKEEWIPIKVPELAVIDKATFESAQERKIRNKELSKRNKKRNYLMSGHFRCGTCGQVMTGYHLRGYLYYQCKTKHPKPNQKPCATANKSIIAHRVDDTVWDWLRQLLTDDDALEAGLTKMIEDNQDNNSTKRKRLNTLNKMVDKAEQTISRLMLELADSDYDDTIRDLFKENIAKKSEELDALKKERDQIDVQLAQVELTEDFRQEIKAMAAQVRGKMSKASFDNKRIVMDKLDLQAVFRYEDSNRWLDLTCSLSPDGLRYNLQEI